MVVGRVGVREVAPDGRQVANDRVGDDRARVEQERVTAPYEIGLIEIDLPGEAADPERDALLADDASPGRPLMSTTCPGVASLSFISGIRLCPPERTLASSPSLASSAVASPSELGA